MRLQAILANPYLRLMRLHQPVGIWLLMWPCWWSATLAGEGLPSLSLLLAFALGALLMRSAGCVINDLWDRDIDRQVERTHSRPLASGELTTAQALALLVPLLAGAAGIAIHLGEKVFGWAAAALPLVALYPLMKRITWWPQAFLGVTFNWGALLGAVAVHGHPTLPALLLYLSGIFWTLGYDTIYAHQDIADDARAGVRSTALKLGNSSLRWVALFYGMSLLMLCGAGLAARVGPLYYAGLLAVLTHFIWQLRSVRTDEPALCRRVFLSNAWAGGLIFIACLAGKT